MSLLKKIIIVLKQLLWEMGNGSEQCFTCNMVIFNLSLMYQMLFAIGSLLKLFNNGMVLEGMM